MKKNLIIWFMFLLLLGLFSGSYVREADAATHVHTEACYSGHRHSDGTGITQINGTSPRGCYTTAITTSTYCYASLTKYSSSVSYSTYTCPNCNKAVQSYCNIYGWICSYGHTSSSSSSYYWSCSNCGWSGVYGGINTGDWTAYPCYRSTTTVTGYKCTLTEDTATACDKVVTSITPISGKQTVYYNGTIDSTCTATYLDGHTATVTCSASGFNKAALGDQTVTLTYSGLVTNAKTTGSLTATVNVTVVDYVSAISATLGTQSIYYGGSIVSTATITKASGGTLTVPCIVSGFSSTTVGTQSVTLTYSGLTTNSGSNPFCTTAVTVLPGLVSITPSYSTQTIYKGDIPVLTATATYMDGSSKAVTPSNNYNASTIGTQTITLSFIDQGITKTTTCTVTVKPNLTSMAVTANKTSVLYNTDIAFTCTAYYEDGSSSIVSASAVTPYQKRELGTQRVTFNYTENGITINKSIVIEVLDYPTTLQVGLYKRQIYQTQSVSVRDANVIMASGSTQSVTPVINPYDNMTVGNEDITFSYSLNGISVSSVVSIEVLPDLYDLELSSDTLTIYKGQDLNLTVYAEFNINGAVKLSSRDYTINGFDSSVYDRSGSYYTLSYINKGVTISKTLFIVVLPNVTELSATYPGQTTEGIQIPFVATVTYEDEKVARLTEADIGKVFGLSIENYDINLVGYQDIILRYQEGDVTVSQTATIRVRAIIKVSIPISSLVSIDSNTGQIYSSILHIDNQSKESVEIGISTIDNKADGLIDVLPNKYSDWAKLGKNASKNIAVGIYYASDNWMKKDLTAPIYIVEAKDSVIGIIDKKSMSSLEYRIKHGNSFENNVSFQYVIQWTISLADD